MTWLGKEILSRLEVLPVCVHPRLHRVMTFDQAKYIDTGKIVLHLLIIGILGYD